MLDDARAPQPIDHWQIDKRIPIALLGTLVANLAAFIVGVTILWTEVRQHGVRLDRLEQKGAADDTRQAELGLAVARLQVATDNLALVAREFREELRAVRAGAAYPPDRGRAP